MIPTPFEDYTFQGMDDHFVEYLSLTYERLSSQLDEHPRKVEARQKLAAIEPYTKLTIEQLNLVIRTLRALKSKDAENSIRTKKSADKIDKWLDMEDRYRLSGTRYLYAIGETRARAVMPDEIMFQIQQRYFVSTIEKWIRPARYVVPDRPAGMRIGSELALGFERALNLSEDEGNWLAEDFRQAARITARQRLVYKSRIRGVPIQVTVELHEGQSLDPLQKEIDAVAPFILHGIDINPLLSAQISEAMADVETRGLEPGMHVRLDEDARVDSTVVMENIEANLHVEDQCHYILDSLHEKNSKIPKLMPSLIYADKYIKSTARGTARNRKILEKRRNSDQALIVCPVTTAVLSRIESWNPAKADEIRDGAKKSIDVPPDIMKGFATAINGKDITIKFSYINGRIFCALPIKKGYNWRRNGLDIPGTLTESVMAGMVGTPAEQIFDHPFSKLLGPVTSAATVNNATFIRFSMAQPANSKA